MKTRPSPAYCGACVLWEKPSSICVLTPPAIPDIQPIADRALAARYLRNLKSTLGLFYPDPFRLASVDLRQNGTVAGIFVGDDRPFDFVIQDQEVSYGLYNGKLDSRQTSYLQTLSDLPLPLSGNDAYSSGFLNAWMRTDRKPSTCSIGVACKGGCISKDDRCRIPLSNPQKRKVKALIDAGKFLHKLGGSSLLTPLLGVAAVGAAGVAIGLSVGRYMGASAAAKPADRPPAPAPRQPRTRRKKYTPEEIPDPWSDTPNAQVNKPIVTKPPQAKQAPITPTPEPPKAKSPPPEVEQLSIDQGIRYVTQEVEKKIVVAPANADGTYQMSPDDIRLAPKTFQYKLPNEISSRAAQQYREQGTTGALEDVEVWNPQVAGAVKVWRVPKDFSVNGESFSEGEVLLVHGHHRLSLAKRAGAIANPDPGQPSVSAKVEQVKVEFIQADNWKQARVLGAMENIAAGAGTSKDAANIFRELNISDPSQLKNQGLSLKNRIAEEGLGLAGLNDRLWRKITDPTNTELSTRKAAYVGQIRNPDLQDEVWKQLKESSSPSDEFAKSLAKTVQHQLETGQIQQKSSNEEEGQFALFDTQKAVANLKDRAEVDAYIESQIASEAAFWNRAAKPQKLKDILSSEGAGDINVERSQEVSEQTSVARYLYQRGKFLQSDQNYTTITDALIQAGNQLRDLRDRGASKTEIDEFKRNTYTSIRDLLAEAMN